MRSLVVVGAAATVVSVSRHYTGLLPILTCVCLYAVAAHGTRRQAAAGVAFLRRMFRCSGALNVPDLTVTDLATSGAFVVAAAALGDAVRSRRHHQAEMVAAADSRADAARDSAARALADERLRIAREMHDVVAHSMSLIAVQAGVGAHVIETDPAAAEQALPVVADTSRDALAQTRSVLGLLQSGDEAAASSPGVAALKTLVQGVRDAGLQVDLVLHGSQRPLPATVDLAAYRVVQEGLTNAMKHAPTRPVAVHLVYLEAAVRIEISDMRAATVDAPPACTAPLPPRTDGRFGLIGLRERAAALGGTLVAGPTPAGGFDVAAELPTGRLP